MKVYLRQLKLDTLLAENNLTVQEFADKVGINRQYVYMLKNPGKVKYSPSPKLRKRMMGLFRCSFNDLFFVKSVR